MFCKECGKEIKDGALFCSNCGTKVVQEQNEEQKNEVVIPVIEKAADEKKKPIDRKLIVLVCAVAIGIVGVLAALRPKTLTKEAAVVTETESIIETVSTAEVEETLTEDVEEESYELLVCVPVEYMSLRENPGLGDDVVAELKAGTYLKWYGESVVVDERDYYKVVVRDSGQEGYVSSRFCVNVEFEPNMEELSVVETDTTIYTYEMMIQDIQTLCAKYSDRLRDRVIGYSIDGREIHEVVLGNPNAENHIMMQAGIHGREYMTSQLVMKMIEYYAYYYEDAMFEWTTYKDIFEKTALHIVPMSNPDGVTISQLGVNALNDEYLGEYIYECYERDKGTLAYEEDSNGDMNWVDHYREAGYNKAASGNTREITFEEYQTIWKANALGVDLNNNFDAGWEGIQLKEYPAYGSFKGYYPLSEPESYALVELAYEHDYQCFISYHARGQLIYYDVNGNTPENSQASLNFANLLDNWIKYEPVNTNKAYNVNLGGFGDWVQLSLKKPSVTIENGKSPCPLVIDEFPAIWYRHRESWAMLGKQFY